MKKTQRRFGRRIRGATLIEAMTAAGLSTMLLFGAVSVFLQGSSSWLKGTARIVVNEDAQGAIRTIAQELREAMAISVASDGQSLTYRLPSKDDDGAYIIPPVWDGVNRSILLSGTNLVIRREGGTDRVVCRKVILTDPQSGSAYKPFTPGAGTITRQLTVMVVTQLNEYKQETAKSRARETIFLRNIPELSR